MAGGQSRRFGSDKALAMHQGRPLLDHAANSLRLHVAALAVVGRDWPGMIRVDDHPEPGLGPLGGICGALSYAQAKGFDAVLSTSCDVLGLSDAVIGSLCPGPAILDDHPVIGLWPVTLLAPLCAWLSTGGRSVFRFADHEGLNRVSAGTGLHNINTPADLAAIQARPAIPLRPVRAPQ